MAHCEVFRQEDGFWRYRAVWDDGKVEVSEATFTAAEDARIAAGDLDLPVFVLPPELPTEPVRRYRPKSD